MLFVTRLGSDLRRTHISLDTEPLQEQSTRKVCQPWDDPALQQAIDAYFALHTISSICKRLLKLTVWCNKMSFRLLTTLTGQQKWGLVLAHNCLANLACPLGQLFKQHASWAALSTFWRRSTIWFKHDKTNWPKVVHKLVASANSLCKQFLQIACFLTGN